MNACKAAAIAVVWIVTSIRPTSVCAQVQLPDARPVSRMQVIPLPNGQVSVRRDGREITRYHFARTLHRPFLYPLVGPAGRSLTRMGHPHDPNTHGHHTSVWVSHHDVDGVNFWADGGAGRIVHRRTQRYEDGDAAAAIAVENAWLDGTGKTLLEEQRRMRAVPLDGKQWLLIVELRLTPAAERVTLGKTPFGMIGVRMAKTIGVADGGGMIRNSNGRVNEEDILWQRARWVDYSGPIVSGVTEGVTLMDHPDNPNHPSFFHVRNDGWMGASLTFDGPLVIQRVEPLRLRYGLRIHSGVPESETIEGHFAQFVELAGP